MADLLGQQQDPQGAGHEHRGLPRAVGEPQAYSGEPHAGEARRRPPELPRHEQQTADQEDMRQGIPIRIREVDQHPGVEQENEGERQHGGRAPERSVGRPHRRGGEGADRPPHDRHERQVDQEEAVGPQQGLHQPQKQRIDAGEPVGEELASKLAGELEVVQRIRPGLDVVMTAHEGDQHRRQKHAAQPNRHPKTARGDRCGVAGLDLGFGLCLKTAHHVEKRLGPDFQACLARQLPLPDVEGDKNPNPQNQRGGDVQGVKGAAARREGKAIGQLAAGTPDRRPVKIRTPEETGTQILAHQIQGRANLAVLRFAATLFQAKCVVKLRFVQKGVR